MNKKTVIILSGGMDSTTLAYMLNTQGHELHALTFNYGQKHYKEIACARKTCETLSIPWQLVDLSDTLQPLLKSSLTDRDISVPEGHYADENMKSTVVPNRNMIMLSIAAGYAASIGATAVAYAAHSGDHAIYPDCRPIFRDAMSTTLGLCHFDHIELLTPFLYIDKGDICRLGLGLRVPFESTWTCYVGGDKPCGRCGACVERAESFADNNEEDPLCKA